GPYMSDPNASSVLGMDPTSLQVRAEWHHHSSTFGHSLSSLAKLPTKHWQSIAVIRLAFPLPVVLEAWLHFRLATLPLQLQMPRMHCVKTLSAVRTALATSGGL